MSKDDNTCESHAVRIIPVEFISDETENDTIIAPVLAAKVENDIEIKDNTEVKNNEPSKHHNFLKTWALRFGTFLTATTALLALILVGTKFAGFRAFTVMSGSMEPEYPVGSMIYVRPIDYKSLKIGDVISYVADNNKTIVTHRIVAIEVDKKDSSVLRFRTQGDANNSADAKLVHYKNVLGTPIVTIPYLGYIAHGVQQPPGIYIALVVGTLLLAWTFLPATLEERRKTARNNIA